MLTTPIEDHIVHSVPPTFFIAKQKTVGLSAPFPENASRAPEPDFSLGEQRDEYYQNSSGFRASWSRMSEDHLFVDTLSWIEPHAGLDHEGNDYLTHEAFCSFLRVMPGRLRTHKEYGYDPTTLLAHYAVSENVAIMETNHA